MAYTIYNADGSIASQGGQSSGGSGLTWFNSVGTFWTTNSTTARFQLAVVIRQMYTATYDQLTQSFTMPYAGTLRQLNVTQNGPTSAAGNIILQKSTDNGNSFNDWITLNGFVAASGSYNNNVKKYAQADPVASLNAGDIVIPFIQYTATGVNQSTTCTMFFACAGAT